MQFSREDRMLTILTAQGNLSRLLIASVLRNVFQTANVKDVPDGACAMTYVAKAVFDQVSYKKIVK